MNQPSTPQYPQIQAANVVTGSDAQNQAYALAQQQYGPEMGAQAQGIADIGQGQSYYNNFGPSTLGQAVGNQYMQNIWPQESAMISNQFANSGMSNSPALASTLANAYGTLGTNVGEYEQGISNQNATNNLSQLMSINPMNYSQPIANSITGQSNEQAQLSQSAAEQNAQAQYMTQSGQYQQGMAQNGAIGTGIGTALGAAGGFVAGGPMGAMMGAGLGGSLGGAVMGGGSASGLGNAMQAMAYYGNQPGMGSTNNTGSYMQPTGFGQAANMYNNGTTSAYGGTNTNGSATVGNLSNQLNGSATSYNF